MSAKLVAYVRLSQFAQEFLAASLDLLQEVLEADEALITDGVREKAEALLAVVEAGRGEL